jgi:uncharacterized membrane protein
MTSKTAILAAAVGSLFVLAGPAFSADDASSEKCYGVAKAAKNDCAGGAHACAGQSSKDGSPKEFVKLPKGTARNVFGNTS